MTSEKNSKKDDVSRSFELDRIKSVVGEDIKKVYQEHYELWWLLVPLVLIIMIMGASHFWRADRQDINSATRIILKERKIEFDVNYPNGYQIIIIDGKSLKPAGADSLSKTFKIDWKHSKVLTNDGYEARLSLASISSSAKRIRSEEKEFSLYAQPNGEFTILNARGTQLFARVLSAQGDYLLILVSFKDLTDEGVLGGEP